MSAYGEVFCYRCSGGHDVESGAPLQRCPARVHGRPCAGVLERVGPGSRKTTRANTISGSVGR